MNCRQTKQYLSLYLDNELGSDVIKQIEEHLQECPACMEYYRSLEATKQYCGHLENMELPLGFHERLHQRLIGEERKGMHGKFRFKFAAGMTAALLLVFIGINLMNGMGLNDKASYIAGKADMDVSESAASYGRVEESRAGISFNESAPNQNINDSAIEAEESFKGSGIGGKEEYDGGSADAASPGLQSAAERKIIKSAYLSVETLEFDRFINTINGKLSSFGGYVESSNVEGIPRNAQGKVLRTAHFEIRVPREYYKQFITDVGELGNLLTCQENGHDITGQYFDTEARLKSLQIQEERLLTILGKAEVLQDIIELERELSNVRYEIESLTGTLKKWDNMVEYSRISLDVYEVKELKEDDPQDLSLGERIIEAFTRSLEQMVEFSKDLVVFLASAIPYLIIFGAIGWIVWKLVKRHGIHKNNNIKGDVKNE